MSQETESRWKPDYAELAYVGERIFHPGLHVGLHRSTRLGKDSTSVKHRLDHGMVLAGYLHPRNHVGFHLKPRIAYYRTSRKGFEAGVLAEAGYMARFYHGQVFEVDDQGGVEQRQLAGQHALMFGSHLSLGRNLHLSKGKPWRWFAQIGAFWEVPYNGYALIHPSLVLGISKYLP